MTSDNCDEFEVFERNWCRRRPYTREEWWKRAFAEPAGHLTDPLWPEWLPLWRIHDIAAAVAGESKLAEYVLEDHESEEQNPNDMSACSEPARDTNWGDHVKWGKRHEWLQASPRNCQDQQTSAQIACKEDLGNRMPWLEYADFWDYPGLFQK